MGFSIDVNDEDVGIRHFQLKKERAVERAIEKVRHNLNSHWQELSGEEIDIFQWALGETWATMGFYEWDHIGFSFMSVDNVKEIISTGKKVLAHELLGTKAFSHIHQILKGLKPTVEEEV